MDPAYDVLIVGGGPTGSACARGLAEAGHRVLQVEEHETIGRPVQCGGLLTPHIEDVVPVGLSHLYHAAFTGAHIYSPGGDGIHLDAGEVKSWAADRAGFDQLMAELATKAGAEQRLGTKVVAAHSDDDGVTARLRTTDGDETRVRARLIIGADGAQSRVAKWFGLHQPKQYISLHGAQMEGLSDLDPSTVYMWLGRERAPGFFTYIIPTSETAGKVEAGVWQARRPARWHYERMFEDPLSRPHLEGARETFTISATIPFGPAKRSTTDRCMLVGDAAGQAKPTTGGGIYTGLVCARELVPVAHEALQEDDCSHQRLQAYHDAWWNGIGRELRFGLRLRHAFLQLSDEQLDDLWQRLSRPEVTAIINAVGDIDYPSTLALRLLREEPGLVRFVPAVLKGFFAREPSA